MTSMRTRLHMTYATYMTHDINEDAATHGIRLLVTAVPRMS